MSCIATVVFLKSFGIFQPNCALRQCKNQSYMSNQSNFITNRIDKDAQCGCWRAPTTALLNTHLAAFLQLTKLDLWYL